MPAARPRRARQRGMPLVTSPISWWNMANDESTGAVNKTSTDVNTALTSDFSNLPSGWGTPTGGGSHLKTTDQVDELGRPLVLTDPNGNTSYTVWDDTTKSSRTYPGW